MKVLDGLLHLESLRLNYTRPVTQLTTLRFSGRAGSLRFEGLASIYNTHGQWRNVFIAANGMQDWINDLDLIKWQTTNLGKSMSIDDFDFVSFGEFEANIKLSLSVVSSISSIRFIPSWLILNWALAKHREEEVNNSQDLAQAECHISFFGNWILSLPLGVVNSVQLMKNPSRESSLFGLAGKTWNLLRKQLKWTKLEARKSMKG